MSVSQLQKTHRHTVKSGQSQTGHTYTHIHCHKIPAPTTSHHLACSHCLSDGSLDENCFICLTFAVAFS